MVRTPYVSCCLAWLAAGLLLFAAQLASAPQQAGKRKLVIEDYYRIQTVGNPQISPDGRWVLFTV